jgi:hypothetical protein
MSMFVLSEGKCQKIVRDVGALLIGRAITNAVKSMKDAKDWI